VAIYSLLLFVFADCESGCVLLPFVCQQLPEFPPKKYFGSLSPALIKERQEGLEKYMKHLVKDNKVLQTKGLRTFLETPDIVGKDKHKEYDFGRR